MVYSCSPLAHTDLVLTRISSSKMEDDIAFINLLSYTKYAIQKHFLFLMFSFPNAC